MRQANYEEDKYNNVFNFIWDNGFKLATSEFIFWRRIGFEFKIPNSSEHDIDILTEDIKKSPLDSFKGFKDTKNQIIKKYEPITI